MADRQRVLPSWMAKKEEKVKEKESSKSRKRKGVARTTFYCMNEKELVEAAISYLTNNGACGDLSLLNDRQVAKDKVVDTIVKIRETPTNLKKMTESITEALEESAESDAQERTYISETDLDVAEVETIPYTSSLEHQRSEGQRSGPAEDHSGLVNVGPEAEKTEARSQTSATADEDDAFRLVREIFFT